MTENKLYAQCREEAARQMIQKNSHLSPPIAAVLCDDEIKQLTAEIYAMKLLDMSQPSDTNDTWFMRTSNDNWNNSETFDDIGTTQQLHDHFVREFNVSLTNEGNNSKQ